MTAQKKASIGRETSAYEALGKSTVTWEAQASQTLLLEKALEYVRTAEVKHTKNQWKKVDGNAWEISNLVYKMWYRFSEETHYDKKLQTSVTDTWCVSWSLVYNVPRQPESDHYSRQYSGDTIHIAGQYKKNYGSLEAAQNYIQGRFDQYDYLFAELSPPIPDKAVQMFRVNGHLLPGYTAEPKRETVVTELLDFVDAGDTQQTAKPAPKPAEKSTAKAPAKQIKPHAKSHSVR